MADDGNDLVARLRAEGATGATPPRVTRPVVLLGLALVTAGVGYGAAGIGSAALGRLGPLADLAPEVPRAAGGSREAARGPVETFLRAGDGLAGVTAQWHKAMKSAPGDFGGEAPLTRGDALGVIVGFRGSQEKLAFEACEMQRMMASGYDDPHRRPQPKSKEECRAMAKRAIGG